MTNIMIFIGDNDYFKISLREKSISDFYIENNIDEDSLSYLGKGEYGEAYSIGDGKVLKITTSENEFEIAQKLENDSSPVIDSFAKIYKTEIVDNSKLIILEELEQDSHIEDLYYELENYLTEQVLSIQYMGHLDMDELEISEELQNFINDIEDIVRAYRYLGIEASDIQPDNLGYSKEGKLKAFDIDDKARK